MSAVTLEALRARVREAVDMTGSSFIADSANSIDAFINSEAKALYALLVSLYEDHFEATSENVSLVAGTSDYSLTGSVLKLKGVDVQDGSEWKSLRPAPFRERNLRSSGELADLLHLRFRLEANKLKFMPAPASSGTARVWFTPQFTKFTNSSDEREFFDHEEYIVQGAAARCAIKEEQDPSPFLALQQKEREVLELAAPRRDAEEPGSVGNADTFAVEDWPWLER